MLKFEKNNLSFDSETCMAVLKDYFVEVLKEADERYLGLMIEE